MTLNVSTTTATV